MSEGLNELFARLSDYADRLEDLPPKPNSLNARCAADIRTAIQIIEAGNRERAALKEALAKLIRCAEGRVYYRDTDDARRALGAHPNA